MCLGGSLSPGIWTDQMTLHQMRALVLLDEGLLGPPSPQGPSSLSHGHRARTAKCGFTNVISLRPIAPSPPMTAARTGCPACRVPRGGDLHFVCKNCHLANAGLKCVCVFYFKCSVFLKDIVFLVFMELGCVLTCERSWGCSERSTSPTLCKVQMIKFPP